MELRVKVEILRKVCSRVTCQRLTSYRLARDGAHASAMRQATIRLTYDI
jgi:hypothetical protein